MREVKLSRSGTTKGGLTVSATPLPAKGFPVTGARWDSLESTATTVEVVVAGAAAQQSMD